VCVIAAIVSHFARALSHPAGELRPVEVVLAVHSTDGIRIRKLDQARRRKTRPRIPGYRAEPPTLFPVSARIGDLLRRARHEVPPHENLLWKRWSPYQQESATRPARPEQRFGAEAPSERPRRRGATSRSEAQCADARRRPWATGP